MFSPEQQAGTTKIVGPVFTVSVKNEKWRVPLSDTDLAAFVSALAADIFGRTGSDGGRCGHDRADARTVFCGLYPAWRSRVHLAAAGVLQRMLGWTDEYEIEVPGCPGSSDRWQFPGHSGASRTRIFPV